MMSYICLATMMALLYAFIVAINSHHKESIKKEDPQRERFILWAFSKPPEDLNNIQELIRLWNQQHGHEFHVKEEDDLYNVFQEIMVLWEIHNKRL